MEWIQFIQEAEAWLRPLPIKIQGVTATHSDQNTWKSALILHCAYCAELKTDLKLRNPSQLKQWLLTIAGIDVGILGKALKNVAIELRHYASQWSVFHYDEFKAHNHWSDFGIFFSPIKDFLVSYLRNPNAADLAVCLQWSCFLTRITLETGFNNNATEFISDDDQLGRLGWTPEWEKLREVMQELVKTYSPSRFLPSFSQGANSDSPRALGAWGKLREGWSFNQNQRYLLAQSGWSVTEIPEEEPRDCQLVFVPKGIDSKRTICEEPAANMFLQQGILKEIDLWFLRDAVLCRHICLHDQSNQRDRARAASISLDVATLDLSAASDSVSWELVQYTLLGSQLFTDLLLTRTESVRLPDGTNRKLNKFAPMGSALCFPVECLIFLGICLLGCQIVGTPSSIGVYGDDLIVPIKAEDEISRLLGVFGFRLNEKKSFWGHERFKESCGGEYFDGIDVSPLYIPRKFSRPGGEASPQLLPSYIQLANSLYLRGYKTMRRYLISMIILPSFPGVMFSSDPERGLFSTHPTNFHLKQRWNSELYRLEVRHQCLIDTGDVVRDDDVKYFLTLLRYRDTDRDSLIYPDDLISVKLTLPRITLEWRWCPTEDTVADDCVVATDGSVIMLNK